MQLNTAENKGCEVGLALYTFGCFRAMQEDEITRNKQKNAFLDYICPSAKRRSGNPGAMTTRATKSQ